MMVANFFASHPVRAVGLMCLGLFVTQIALAGLTGQLGQIGSDNDDVMRLVQIRDLMAGQGWFDHVQPRLGPEGGTLMHWSRLVDAPIVGLTYVFDLFLPPETALAVAYSIWPPMTASLVVIGVFWVCVGCAATMRPYWRRCYLPSFWLLIFGLRQARLIITICNWAWWRLRPVC